MSGLAVFSPVRESLKDLSDSDVVAAFLDGKTRAFDELVRRYQARLRNFVFRAVRDRERAEDVVQEVFLRVSRHIHNFDRSRKFSTWIYTIASNLAKNEMRNRSRNRLVLSQAIEKHWDDDWTLNFEDPRSRPDDMHRQRHLREVVEAAVEELPPHHRHVFSMRELEGKSYGEMAEILGIPLGTVKSRISRARNAFAGLVAPNLD